LKVTTSSAGKKFKMKLRFDLGFSERVLFQDDRWIVLSAY
jgi:hypothetical protein